MWKPLWERNGKSWVSCVATACPLLSSAAWTQSAYKCVVAISKPGLALEQISMLGSSLNREIFQIFIDTFHVM